MPAQTTIKVRRGTAAAWTAANPTLAQGEPGLETDTGKVKVGDGTTAWNSLAYWLGSAFANPMTTQDDIIVGGASGSPTRLGKGSDGQVLTVDPTTHHLIWATPSASFTNPMTTSGDIITGGTAGAAQRLSVGSSGQVLTVVSGAPAWATGGGGGSSDAILGQSGVGGARISGLQASPDIDVAGTNDDEFNAALSGWSVLGTLDVSNANSDIKSHWHGKKNTVGLQIHGIYKAAPTLPFTVTVKFADLLYAGNYNEYGIGIGSSGTAWWTASLSPYPSPWSIQTESWTNNTTRSGAANYTQYSQYFPRYLRLVVHSSTNVDVLASQNGLIWNTAVTGVNPGFTITNVGIMLDANGVAAECAVDWIRFS